MSKYEIIYHTHIEFYTLGAITQLKLIKVTSQLASFVGEKFKLIAN